MKTINCKNKHHYFIIHHQDINNLPQDKTLFSIIDMDSAFNQLSETLFDYGKYIPSSALPYKSGFILQIKNTPNAEFDIYESQ